MNTQKTHKARTLFGCLFICVLALSSLSCSYPESRKQETTKASISASPPTALSVGEGFQNPLGYYEIQPRFNWKIAANSPSRSQSAYQIQVSNTTEFSSSSLLWDTQKIDSNQTAWIKYQGQTLSSREKIFWRVRYWDQNNQRSEWSDRAELELGLLDKKDWVAQWIRHPEANETVEIKTKDGVFQNKFYRPQYLRKAFSVDKGIQQARLYITAKGIFKAYINGKAISDDVMTPGWTAYQKRIETLTYDVTQHVTAGNNALAAVVAEGWYGGRIIKPLPREVPPSELLAQLEILYTDGKTRTISTDETWRATINGPIREASNYDGETYDANFEMPGWSTSGFDAAKWKAVLSAPLDEAIALRPKRHTTSKTKLVLTAKHIVQVDDAKPGVTVFDMGQNMVGVPEITIPVVANQTVTLRFAEALNKNSFYTKNLRSAKASDYYIPSKDGVIRYTPTFTFHGYRYVELSGYDQSQTPTLSWVKGLVQHSDFDVHASFTSSHNKLNKLADNVVWGLRGNFLDIPTDCPQRDERLGWTGDAQIFATPSMYMADVYGFWAAWLQTLREEQDVSGRIPNFVPTSSIRRYSRGVSSGWGDAAVIIPWELYLLTGDKHVLKENYEMMQSWIAFHEAKVKDNVSNMGGFGDWLQPYPQAKIKPTRGDTPKSLISTAYFARSLDFASQTATELGYEADAKAYANRFQEIRNAFRNAFYDEQVRVKTPATQTSYLLPLAFNLFNEEDTQKARNHLLDEIKKADNHLRTGFLGTPLLAPVLQDMGRSDLMFDILFKETYPSWFYSINNGATTTWERWNSYSLQDGFSPASMNSLNHYAYGAVAQWFYTGILGVQSQAPGFSEFKVMPQFTEKLNKASGSVVTLHGDISVSWVIKKGELNMHLSVPKNTTALLSLPGVSELSVTGPSNSKLEKQLDDTRLQPGDYHIKGAITL